MLSTHLSITYFSHTKKLTSHFIQVFHRARFRQLFYCLLTIDYFDWTRWLWRLGSRPVQLVKSRRHLITGTPDRLISLGQISNGTSTTWRSFHREVVSFLTLHSQIKFRTVRLIHLISKTSSLSFAYAFTLLLQVRVNSMHNSTIFFPNFWHFHRWVKWRWCLLPTRIPHSVFERGPTCSIPLFFLLPFPQFLTSISSFLSWC